MHTPAPPDAPEALSHPPVKCGGCRSEIEACRGVHGDWMHTTSRAEACPSGGFARPETLTEINRAKKAS